MGRGVGTAVGPSVTEGIIVGIGAGVVVGERGVGVGGGIQETSDSLKSPKEDSTVCQSGPPSIFLLKEKFVSGAFVYEYCSSNFADEEVGGLVLSNKRIVSVEALLKLKSALNSIHDFGEIIVCCGTVK